MSRERRRSSGAVACLAFRVASPNRRHGGVAGSAPTPKLGTRGCGADNDGSEDPLAVPPAFCGRS